MADTSSTVLNKLDKERLKMIRMDIVSNTEYNSLTEYSSLDEYNSLIEYNSKSNVRGSATIRHSYEIWCDLVVLSTSDFIVLIVFQVIICNYYSIL